MSLDQAAAALPRALASYPDRSDSPLVTLLAERIRIEPFNAIATGVFVLAILHTFMAPRFARQAERLQHRHDDRARALGQPIRPIVGAEILHFFGEVEVVFGLWAIVLMVAMFGYVGWEATAHYFDDVVSYTEPLFVVVIMALAASRPIITLAESALGRVARFGGSTPAAWWVAILTIGPMLGSLVTEPAAMTISALLLARQFYAFEPGRSLKYCTLGLLFVNVSIGGTLTHFAAPPVLMVARPWGWDFAYVFGHFGWRAAIAIVVSTLTYFVVFRRALFALGRRRTTAEAVGADEPGQPMSDLLPIPRWITIVHLGFMAWTVFSAHHPALFIGGFLIFLGFTKATAPYQSQIDLKGPLLVGFFLGGLVIHGGLQAWWIAPVLGRLAALPLFVTATFLTAFNDNALITYLATLVPNLDDALKIAVVGGAVTGGGLTVIANAPNPAGQALLGRYFGNAIAPVGLFLGALPPTLIAAIVLRWR